MMSEDFRKRLAINKILSSRDVGFYRLVGKDAQRKYRSANMTYSDPDRAALLDEIIVVYTAAIENKVPAMDEKEKKHKLKLIKHLATKEYERMRK